MKIASVIFESLAKPGGYEIFTYNLLRALAERGHEVTLYVPHRRRRKDHALLDALPFQVRALPRLTGLLMRRAPWLLALLLRYEQKQRRHDVWQVMGAWPEGRAVCGLAGHVPLCLRTHGDDLQLAPELGYGLRQDPRLDAAVRDTLSRMDLVVVLTPGLVPDAVSLGVPLDRVLVIPNGIDLGQYQQPRDREAIRRRLKVPPDHFLILTVGRNHPKKGFDLIPETARLLRERGQDFTWLVLGGDTARLLPDIERLGLGGTVQPMEPIPPLPDQGAAQPMPPDALVDIYAAADAFAFPSRLETFGRVVLEAMAAGTPVVTTDAPGCRDVAGRGAHAIMVPVDDPKAMAQALDRLMTDPALRQDYSQRGLTHAQSFDWHTVTADYEAAYARAMAEFATKMGRQR